GLEALPPRGFSKLLHSREGAPLLAGVVRRSSRVGGCGAGEKGCLGRKRAVQHSYADDLGSNFHQGDGPEPAFFPWASSPVVQKVMPTDSFYFSIVRDPASLAESAFSYYRGVVPAFRRARSLSDFLASPQNFYRPGERGSHYARNLLWFDFGLDPPASPGLAAIHTALLGLDRIFHLVLLTEYMDESLVLLRDALCWSFRDVVAFQHNLRNPEAVHQLGPTDAAQLRAWNHLDWHLYTHFNRTFWARVKRFGTARMAGETAVLRKQRAEFTRRCVQGGGPLEPGHIADGRIRPFQFGQVPILGYALQPSLASGLQVVCQQMVTPELQYKDLLDAKQHSGRNGQRGPGGAAGMCDARDMKRPKATRGQRGQRTLSNTRHPLGSLMGGASIIGFLMTGPGRA
ncbi:Galactose-3-O-sulfotransferase 2, partial [Ophiophagus hannah]